MPRRLKKKNYAVNLCLGLAIILSILFVIGINIPLKAVFDPIYLESYFQEHENYLEILFIVAYTVLTVVGIPGTVLTIVGGGLFGLWHGTLISIISATLGALCSFWTARYLLQNYAQRKLNQSKKLIRFQQAVLDQPFTFVLTTRFIPISPYNLVNYLFGLTTINWFDYTFATFIGVIPGSFAYTWIGVSGKVAMSGGDRLSLFLALTFLALLTIIPLIFKKQKRI